MDTRDGIDISFVDTGDVFRPFMVDTPLLHAYVLIMVALFVFAALAFKRLKADERRLQALEAHLHEQS